MSESAALELILGDEVRRLLDAFAAVMKIQAVIFSDTGNIIKRGGDVGNCAYCRYMQEKYFGVERCRVLDAQKRDVCSRSNRIICYHCHGGLDEMIAPVNILDKAAGFVVLGQFRTGETLPPEAAGDAEARRLFMSLPCYTTAEVAGIEDMLRLLINYTVDKELITLSGDFRYQRIIRYFESRLTEKITVAEVAKHLKISESTLTHFLRREHGITFKRLLLRKRLEKAEAAWRREPELTLGEAAALAGYEDYHYFSRLYRQERGFPPGEYRRRLKRDRGEAAAEG